MQWVDKPDDKLILVLARQLSIYEWLSLRDSKRRGSSQKNAPGNLVRSKIESKKIQVIWFYCDQVFLPFLSGSALIWSFCYSCTPAIIHFLLKLKKKTRKSDVAIDPCRDENSPRHLGEWQIRSFFLSFFEKKKEKPNNRSFAQYWTTLIFRAEYPTNTSIYSKYYQ